ncbi:MAG: DUF4349 domain-containing protein [Oscillospiraceae bacterium]|nr:DUF4349 domain-containing protein [Oscillospiraceae bacterium]
MKKRLFAIFLAAILTLGLAACGAKTDTNYMAAGGEKSEAWDPPAEGYWASDEDAPAAPQEAASNSAKDSQSSGERSTLPDGVKMIYRANMELQTTEFERAAADVRSLTQSLGGYFEEQSMRNFSSGYRSASYTVRVPAERFEDFLRQIGDLCHISYQTQSAEDVSEYYYDMESRLETARIKLDRLQELLSRAELMEDIITLENAISETEYQIESLSGEKRHYDSLIGYSTIYLTLNEVYRVTEPESAPLTFGQRIANAFRDGLRDFGDAMEDLAEWLAYNWLTLLVIAAIVVGIVRLVRRLRSKRPLLRREKKSKDAPAQAQEEKKD